MQAALIGPGALSNVAVCRRLQHAADWLGYAVLHFLQDRGLSRNVPPLSVRIVDVTTVSKPGSRGTARRVHVGLDLAKQQMTTVELTGPEGGETLTAVPICFDRGSRLHINADAATARRAARG